MTVVDSSLATAELFDQLAPRLDAQTINVIERHRSPGVVKSRGWLVRRALALADMIGLSAAFVIAMVWWAGSPVDDHVSDLLEVAIFLLSLPAWVVAANLYGLYSNDEERTDHSTADDLVGVFHLVTVGSWVLLPRRHLHGGRGSEPPAPAHVLGARDRRSSRRCVRSPVGSVAAPTSISRTRSSWVQGTSDSSSRANCDITRSTA